MAEREGRGGGAGWFIVGLLIGVAGTLATQRFIQSGADTGRPASVADVAPAAVDAPIPETPKPKPVTRHIDPADADASDSGPPRLTRAQQEAADMADDAAAAGMTTRAPHRAAAE
jgi:hypothetical protein